MTVGAPSRPIGRLEELARARITEDLVSPPPGCWFDDEAADRAVQFIEGYCRHHKGEWAGQPLILEDWQKDCVVRPLFGWKLEDGNRRFRTAYLEVPRKNGKSELAAAVGLYLTVADQEAGAEVYSSATKKDQAKIVHDTAVAMVKASPELKRFVKIFRNNINVPQLGAKFEPLGADADTLDGLNPHGNIVDELHAHRDRRVWDVLDTAMGARRQPLTFAITTAGVYAPESIGWQMHDLAVKILEGVIEDEHFFAFIAAADEDDDWSDPATWAKANPNIGVSVKEDYLARQCKKAQDQPSFLNTFLRLHLNRWTQQVKRWIAIEAWNACEEDLDRAETEAREEELEGRVSYGGLDLSSKLDITALLLAFPGPDGWDVLSRFWVPEDTILRRSRDDRVPYDAWVRDGWMSATPGNVVDYDFIEAEVQRLAERYQLEELAFDPWNATQVATHLGDEGLTMVEVRQGYKSLSEPAKELEKLVVSGKLRHGGHPVLRWMASNVAVREDPNNNIAPDKEKSTERIDGIVALIMALSRGIVHHDQTSVYETRGVRMV